MVLCDFKQYYYDYQKEDEIPFICDQESMDENGFCIFHNKNYLEIDNPSYRLKTIVTRFYNRIDEAIAKKTSLFCIGYILPDIKISNTFDQPVYFNDCRFQNADFSEAIFNREATFSGAVFKGEANFSTVSDMEKALLHAFRPDKVISKNSETPTFLHLANFMNCVFLKEASFTSLEMKERSTFAFCSFAGNVNFSNTSFTEVNFSNAKFLSNVKFSNTKFNDRTCFHNCIFSGQALFSGQFNDNTDFSYVTFEKPDRIRFEVIDLSKVSFRNSDITRVLFNENAKWGSKNKFQVIEEIWFKDEKLRMEKQLTLEGVLSVYRNLRENYEFRRMYNDAGKFFIREMELKRNYRYKPSKFSNLDIIKFYISRIRNKDDTTDYYLVKNGRIRRNLSLTGLYYHFSRYGESIARPSITAIGIILLTSLLWLSQSNPHEVPSFPSIYEYLINPPLWQIYYDHESIITVVSNHSKFIGLDRIGNFTHWSLALERSIIDFLPLFSFNDEIKTGLLDFVIKVFGGLVIFGLVIIALRRKFERKYYH